MRSPIQVYLEDLHARFAAERSGEVATYIPELGLADPDLFGICVAMTDGRVYEVGDTRRSFTIQSMSKPFTYGLALEDSGREAVAAKVGVEPSGDAFNSISLAPVTGRPLNPMINAGAITAAALVAGSSTEERFARVLDTYSRYAGRRLEIDEEIFASERKTGHRNRAIGHMLRNFDILHEDPDETLDVYFRQCSIAVDCRDVAVMAATLANGGRNPVTGERVLSEDLVERVLSVMTTCGMYDGSGQWVDAVGLPAKSGVAGGILAVLPGQLAVCVFSPRLNVHGNSVRGVAVCRALAEELHLHSLRVARSARSTIRMTYDVAAVPSRRRRSMVHGNALSGIGGRAVFYELQGDLTFAGAERVVRTIVDRADDLDMVVLDVRAVDRIATPAARMLVGLHRELFRSGKQLALVTTRGPVGLAAAAGLKFDKDLPMFAELDTAREWCEDRILGSLGLSGAAAAEVALADTSLCRGLDETDVADLAAHLSERHVAAGETIIRTGAPATEIFLVLAGEVGVYVPLVGGESRRLASLPAGSLFGELAVIGQATRTADVVAERAATLMVLNAATFERLTDTNPGLKARLLTNMLANAYEIVARMTREVAALSHGR